MYVCIYFYYIENPKDYACTHINTNTNVGPNKLSKVPGYIDNNKKPVAFAEISHLSFKFTFLKKCSVSLIYTIKRAL